MNSIIQEQAYNKLRELKVGALFMKMGSGKTKVTLDLVKDTDCDYLLYVCPFSVKNTIKDEIDKWGLNIMREIKMKAMEPILVKISDVYANDYNPNVVAKPELDLLKLSIEQNGFCFPIVAIKDNEGKYCIIDGFHRYTVMKDILKQEYIPVVVLNHDISNRITATVQFNRARGTHQIIDMSKLVMKLIKQNVPDSEIIKKLGMDPDELLRLKQMTGLKEAFKNQQFSNSWEEFITKYDNVVENN